MTRSTGPAQPAYGYRPADASAPPAVSVVTPYQDGGVALLATARSLLRQSLQQWEWLVVNAGTGDPAAQRALLPLRSADARMRVLDRPRLGPGAASSAGAAAARAPLVYHLACGALLDPTALETFAWVHEARTGHEGGDTLFSSHTVIRAGLPFHNRLAHPAGERRVLMIIPWMLTGGTEQFALDVAAGLAGRGARVSVCLTNRAHNTWMGELLAITGDVFDLPAFLPPGEYPRFLRYLVQSRGISTVWISQSQIAYRLLSYLRASCPGVSFVDYNHAEQPHRHGGLPRFGLEHTALLDLHVVASDHLRRWMVERGADPGRVEVCTVNVDAGRWAPDPARRSAVRAALGVAPETPLILFVARLSAEKRAQLAARILRRLRDAGAPFLCLVVGDGEDLPWLRLFVLRHRLGRRVRLLGNVPQQRVRELMCAGDILLLPSEREGIALTIYQAMACGMAPLASDVGGQRELVTPECGVLLPLGADEEQAYVQALRRLIADPELRERMGAAGRARIVAQYTSDRMADRMWSLLDRADELARAYPRPTVDPGVALPAATLAVEHFALEARLRAFPPVRLALRLRHTSFARPLQRLLARFRSGAAARL
jgi:glycosyltransferase involved in cell wall biosynthesis